MATIWITYAWADNNNNDVDFAAQELIATGLTVNLDRWNIQAGRRLWEQIEQFIQDPILCDGWVLYATQNSLGSQPCKEEFAYALDRAINMRGQTFPVIGLFPGPVDNSLIPAGIRTRLYVSLTDPDWKERIRAAAEGCTPSIARPSVSPYLIQIHSAQAQTGRRYTIEVRPRAGTWAPFFAAIPATEKHPVNPSIVRGASSRPISGGILHMCGEGPSSDGVWWIMFAQDEATPTQSYYINCNELPSKVAFGVNGGQPQYLIDPLT